MKVERTEIYDFTIVFTENEFNAIAFVASKLEWSVDRVVDEIVRTGIKDFSVRLLKKESKDGLDG